MSTQIISKNELLDELKNYHEELTEIGTQVHRSKVTACDDGCSFCCHLHITLKPYELLPIVEHVRSLSDDEQTKIKATVQSNCEKIDSSSDEELLLVNFDCPFLKEKSCSIYDFRPTSCRIAHSLSKDLCEKAYHSPSLELESEHIPELIDASRQCEDHFEERLGEYHDVSDYSMNPALLEALADPEWIDRFISGDEVFSDDALSRV